MFQTTQTISLRFDSTTGRRTESFGLNHMGLCGAQGSPYRLCAYMWAGLVGSRERRLDAARSVAQKCPHPIMIAVVSGYSATCSTTVPFVVRSRHQAFQKKLAKHGFLSSPLSAELRRPAWRPTETRHPLFDHRSMDKLFFLHRAAG